MIMSDEYFTITQYGPNMRKRAHTPKCKLHQSSQNIIHAKCDSIKNYTFLYLYWMSKSYCA